MITYVILSPLICRCREHGGLTLPYNFFYRNFNALDIILTPSGFEAVLGGVGQCEYDHQCLSNSP